MSYFIGVNSSIEFTGYRTTNPHYMGCFDVDAPLPPPKPVHRRRVMHERTDSEGEVWTSSDRRSLDRYVDERNKLIAACKEQEARIRKQAEFELAAAVASKLAKLVDSADRASQGRI